MTLSPPTVVTRETWSPPQDQSRPSQKLNLNYLAKTPLPRVGGLGAFKVNISTATNFLAHA